MTKTDDILMVALQQGDVDAFGELYARHHRPLSKWTSKRFGLPIEDGEEIASRGLLSAYDARNVFSPSLGSFRAWLYRITERSALTLLRERARIAPVELSDEVVESSFQQSSTRFRFDGDMRENLLSVAKLLAKLSPEQREAVRLLILEELSGRQAAELANVPEGTLASRLHKAKEKLRAWLNSRPPKGGSGGSGGSAAFGGDTMKRNRARDVDADVLRSLSLQTRTDAELFALLGIMDNQHRSFAAMAWRRLGKRAWHAIAPLKYRAGWLCAAVSGMLFITATSVAYNEYTVNADLRVRVNAIQRKMDESPVKVIVVKASQPADSSCIPIRFDEREHLAVPAKSEKAKRESIEKLKKLVNMCVVPDLQVSTVAGQLGEASIP
jgi:RNA polymerase sigma-70 factor (ECF subfamily)